MPWFDFFYGIDRRGFLASAFQEAVMDCRQPKVVLADLPELPLGTLKMGTYRPGIGACFDADRRLYSIETALVAFTSSRHRLSTFQSRVVLQTHSDSVFHALLDAADTAKPVLVHGISVLNPAEIKSVSQNWPRGESPTNILHSFLHLSRPEDIAVYKNANKPAVSNEVDYSEPNL